MLGGATGQFSDAQEYRRNLPDLAAELVVTQAGVFDAQLTWAKLPNVQLLRAREVLARVAYITLPVSALFVSFATQPGLGLFWNGVSLLPGDVVFHRLGERLHQRTAGSRHWGLLSIAPPFFTVYGSALAGQRIALPSVGRILRPRPEDLARLLRLHAKVGHLVETKPATIVHPEIGRAMEQELLRALVTCLVGCNARDERSASPQHTEIMGRFEAVLATQSDHLLPMRELCTTIGVTEQTLRLCCRTFLGIVPSQYMRLRRLNLARAAMLTSSPATGRVADFARRFGFRNPDRFAASYRLAFGEAPSATLIRLRNLRQPRRFSESA